MAFTSGAVAGGVPVAQLAGGRPGAAAAAAAPAAAGSSHNRFLEELAKADEAQKRNMLGEKLYPTVANLQPARAGKITGMLLEMETSEVLHLLESEASLREKVAEAVDVLQKADAAAAAAGQR
jgi:polyadenylate-binding protein